MYKINISVTTNEPCSVNKTNEGGTVLSIPFNKSNTDYQRFKQDIEAGAELQDADGNVMSADDAQAFVATLP